MKILNIRCHYKVNTLYIKW